jgi:cell division protein FtsI (penicillin-binding protein 3)
LLFVSRLSVSFSSAMATRTRQVNRPVAISRWRMNAVLLVAVLALVGIAGRLGNLQIVQHQSLVSRARAEIDQQISIPPRRGTIRDRAGNVLALDVDRESLFVQPQNVDQRNAPRLALMLSSLLGKPAPEILAALQDKDHYWITLKRWLDPEIAKQVAKLVEDEPALQLIYEPRRVYPQGSFAAQTIGAVNFEGVGISGVEGHYDDLLKGVTGTITAEVDAEKNPIWIAPQQSTPASNGADLDLTIDPLIQHVIETELKAAVDKHSAAGGTVIVMDPKTGAIRGMASYPTFDPNRYNEYKPEMYNINPAIGGTYEPGSTFKIVTISAGLQVRAFTPDTQVDDEGSIDRYGWPLQNFDGNGHGMITPGEVLKYSSNVGALQFNEMTGPEKFYKIVDAYGFGKPTGIDLAGEEGGIVHKQNSPGWDPVVFDTNAYGQGIAVTPLQLVRMAAAVGNDGKLMRPYIVEQRCHGDVCETTKPKEDGQPIGPSVAQTVREMLVVSANHYVDHDQTGATWMMPGYRVGAKTGTSSVAEGGSYNNEVIGSVLGIAPADNARYAILVKIDHPQDDQWGVLTALPVYEAVIEQLLRYERIAPDPSLVGPGQLAGVAYRNGQ